MQKHENILIFKPEVARKKPETILHKNTVCPFCDVANLTNILKKSGNIIWLLNKYQMLEDTWQTVIIESAKHDGDFSNYSPEENQKIIEFAVAAWDKIVAEKKYKSVVLYKNYGPLSGGSLSHPHMQIVGFTKMDIYDDVREANLEGHPIYENAGVSLNISSAPIMGPLEMNICLEDPTRMDTFAKIIQKSVQYVLEDCFDGSCDSYNLFFYKNKNKQTVAKVMPRFVVSPYFVGYKLSGISDAKEFRTVEQEVLAKIKS